MASQFGKPDNVKVLLEHRAVVDQPADNKVAPLYIAAEKGNVECIKLLLAAKADVNRVNGSYGTAYRCANKYNHPDAAQVLKSWPGFRYS